MSEQAQIDIGELRFGTTHTVTFPQPTWVINLNCKIVLGDYLGVQSVNLRDKFIKSVLVYDSLLANGHPPRTLQTFTSRPNTNGNMTLLAKIGVVQKISRIVITLEEESVLFGEKKPKIAQITLFEEF